MVVVVERLLLVMSMLLLMMVGWFWWCIQGREPPVVVPLGCSLLACTSATVATYPLTVIRTRLQVRPATPHLPRLG
jgi:hypothetical protein